jgi:hypothetical protein
MNIFSFTEIIQAINSSLLESANYDTKSGDWKIVSCKEENIYINGLIKFKRTGGMA